MSSPSVALIVLSHNDGRYIEEAVRSIAAQTYLSALERIFLADDASTDDTIEAAKSAWTGPFAFVELPARANLGQWPNLNRALEHCFDAADWALVLHADDHVQPDWLQEMMRRIGSCDEKVGTVCCSWNNFSEERTEAGENAADAFRRVRGGTAAVAHTLMRGCWWKISGAAIRREAFSATGAFNAAFPYSGDWEWLLRFQQAGWDAEYIPRSLVNYRQHSAATSSVSFQNNLDIIEALRLLDMYGLHLDKSQRAAFVLRRAGFATRRLARGIASARPQSLGAAGRTYAHILRSLTANVLA